MKTDRDVLNHGERPQSIRALRILAGWHHRCVFTARAELHGDYVWVEAEDLGGPWRSRQHDDRPHGLDLVEALTGPDGWGVEPTSDGGRVAWARLDLTAGE